MWHKRASQDASFPTLYPAFKVQLRTQFGQIDEVRHFRDRLHELKQVASVREYVQTFEVTIQHIDDATEGELLHRFIYGLKPQIRGLVLARKAATLGEAEQFALAFEDAHSSKIPVVVYSQNTP